jgi:hypothetical protein
MEYGKEVLYGSDLLVLIVFGIFVVFGQNNHYILIEIVSAK